MTESQLAQRAQSRCEFVPASFTVNTSAYVAGNQLGPVLTIKSANSLPDPFDGDPALSVILQDLLLVDNAGQKIAADCFFFNSLPSFNTDHAAWAPTAADMLNCIGKVSIAAGNYSDSGSGQAVAQVANCGIVLKPKPAAASTGAAIYAVFVTRGTPTYLAASLLPKFHFSQGL